MPFENFPYADMHNLNLDWLLKQVKEDHDLLSGMDFQTMVDQAVQDAIDDGRIGALINNTLLAQINNDISTLQTTVGQHTTRIAALEALAHDADDYVEEAGIDGIWVYRKWHSGVAECWTSQRQLSPEPGTGDMTANGALYQSPDYAIPFPSGLFIGTPIASATSQQGGGMMVKSTGSTTATNLIIEWLRTNSNEAPVYYSVNAHGRWK